MKSGCGSSEKGFPKRKKMATDTTIFFIFVAKSFCSTAAIHSACLCGSFKEEKRWSQVDPAPAQGVQSIITHDCGILLEKSLT